MLGRLIAVVAVVMGAVTVGAQEVTWPGVDFGRYHALIIGNNDYRHLRKLATAVDDAEAVATLLEENYGFRVTKLVNATRRDITGAFNDLRKTLTEADNLLVYYAGHGVLDEEADRGYWLPVDARRDDDSEWFSNGRITGYLKAMSAQHVVVANADQPPEYSDIRYTGHEKGDFLFVLLKGSSLWPLLPSISVAGQPTTAPPERTLAGCRGSRTAATD